jgi:hypothetical protein
MLPSCTLFTTCVYITDVYAFKVSFGWVTNPEAIPFSSLILSGCEIYSVCETVLSSSSKMGCKYFRSLGIRFQTYF